MKTPTKTPGKTDNVSESAQKEKVREIDGQIKVSLFCGGRGSASLIRELMRWPQIHLSLLVNGYDDGLSTGQLRDLVPHMLGPSDFRKNLSRLVDLHSSEQYALQAFLEYRFAANFSEADAHAFEEYIEHPDSAHWLPSPMDVLFRELQPSVKKIIIGHLQRFLRHQAENGQVLNYPDCSLGNLVFAGVYLESNSDFNLSVKNLASLAGSPAQIINVTRGENRILVALKADGQVLSRESEIVGGQSESAIIDLFLLEQPLDEGARRQLSSMTVEQKREFLEKLDSRVELSPEADQVLRHSDVIIYGPGTQFSSLLPSYKTRNLPQAIEESQAKVKIFIANLDEDNDIKTLSVSDLVDRALTFMDNPSGSKGLISHIFWNEPRNASPAEGSPAAIAAAAVSPTTATAPITASRRVPLGLADAPFYKTAMVVRGSFESTAQSGTHSGYSVIKRVIDLYDAASAKGNSRKIEIYVDLRNRSQALDPLLHEFVDLPWTDYFEQIQISVNRPLKADVKLPPYANLVGTDYRGQFSEVDALLNWLSHSDADYLATLSGDGSYRLQDILVGIEVLRLGSFGAVYGSRNQSRNQLRSSLSYAYGEHSILRFISFCGAFFFTTIFAVLFGQIFSDPFTGFRIYRRSKFTDKLCQILRRRSSMAAASVTRMMLMHNIEIAEIPVVYRTYRGFTKPAWRLLRGLRNIGGLFR